MKKLFAVLCLVVLVIPAAGLFVNRPDLSAENRDRTLAESILLRDRMVALYADMNRLLGVSGSDQAVLGKNGTLYLPETLPQAAGISLLTDEQVQAVADRMAAWRDELAERGCRFIFIGAPNKATVVPEDLPYYVVPASGPGALDRLQERLRELGVAYIDAKALLTEEKGLYYVTDTHWNERGALKIYRALRAAVQADAWDMYDDLAFETESRIGDLTELIYPKGGPAEQTETAKLERRFKTRGIIRTPMDLRISATYAGGQYNVIMLRDSFANNFFPYVANNAASTQILRESAWKDSLWKDGTDVVILEIAERNIIKILDD